MNLIKVIIKWMCVIGLGGSCVLSFGIIDYYNKRAHGIKDDEDEIKLKKKAKANVRARLEKESKDKLKK